MRNGAYTYIYAGVNLRWRNSVAVVVTSALGEINQLVKLVNENKNRI